jgi:hypothetical protein
MKNWYFAKWSTGLAVALIPLLAGCAQSTTSEPVIVMAAADENVSADAAASTASNAPSPGVTEQNLENAPAKVISTPDTAAQSANLSGPAAEVAKLAQSGVDENVMLAYVNNSTSTFNLGSDQIIYLNDIGVPGNVVTAMMQHDQKLSASAPPPPAAAAPEQQPQTSGAVEAPLTPPPADVVASPQENVTYSYFYDSLAPYGSWVEIEGYGPCWRPSVVAVDPGWSPYCDHGHWIYTDCGWYWASDYSWGWAPFHYGRWFRHRGWGWCWAPDTVWGPAWVNWRYSPGYCGWAPLPPAACWTPGFGFTYYGRGVGVSFGFGISADCFTFVRVGDFCDRRPWHHRIPRHDVTMIFNNTTIINPVVEVHGGTRFHKGIPVDRITAATHTEIKPVRVRETTDVPRGNHGEHFDRNAHTLTVFHPRLPDPPAQHPVAMVGQGVKPATTERSVRETEMHKGIPRQSFAPATQSSIERHNEREPIRKAPGVLSVTPRSEPVAGNNARNDFRQTAPTRNEAPFNSLNSNKRDFENAPQQRFEKATPTERPAPNPNTTRTPQRNELLNRREQQMTAPLTPPSAPNRNQFDRGNSQRFDTPRYQQREERVVPQTPAPAVRQPEVRSYQSPPQWNAAPTQPSEPQRNQFERSAPPVQRYDMPRSSQEQRAVPRTEMPVQRQPEMRSYQAPSAPAAPSYSRPEVRQAPAAQAPQNSGDNSHSRRDH